MVVEGAIASVLFRIPILQHLCRWFGSRPATKKNIHYLLDRGSVGLMVGGVAEIYLAERAREVCGGESGRCMAESEGGQGGGMQ